jgi:hypothetical protein
MMEVLLMTLATLLAVTAIIGRDLYRHRGTPSGDQHAWDARLE